MSLHIVCRKALAADLDRIMAIESRGFSEEAFSRRQLRYLMLRAKGAFFVAVLQDIVVGYISLLARRDHKGRIYSLAVDQDYRGRGIAVKLIDIGIDFLCSQGMRAIFLEVAVDNFAAISLYEKKGFAKRTIKKAYYHSGADAYSMVRGLTHDCAN